MKIGKIEAKLAVPNGLSFHLIQSIQDYSSTLKMYNLSKVYSIWVTNGYGDQWQMSAMEYNSALWIQVYSKWGATLERIVTVYLLGI